MNNYVVIDHGMTNGNIVLVNAKYPDKKTQLNGMMLKKRNLFR